MTTLLINLPDDVKARLEAQAAQGGFTSIEQYAQALLLASSEAPAVDDSLEELLSAKAGDAQPALEFTPQFCEQFREQVRSRRAGGGARA